jgi:hypothetical protein
LPLPITETYYGCRSEAPDSSSEPAEVGSIAVRSSN